MLAFVTNVTSTVLRRKLVQSSSARVSPPVPMAPQASRRALGLLLQAGSAVLLISAGFVVPLPSALGEWQAAAQYALSFAWIMAMISAVSFLGRPGRFAVTHHVRPRTVHRPSHGRATRFAR